MNVLNSSIGDGHASTMAFMFRRTSGEVQTGAFLGAVVTSAQVGAADIVIGTKKPGGVADEKARITGDGRFGIGTQAPAGLLHVSGKAEPTLRLTSTDPQVETAMVLDGASTFRLRSTSSTSQYGANRFVVTRDGSSAPLFAVDGGGNMGVGTSIPTAALELFRNDTPETNLLLRNQSPGGGAWNAYASALGSAAGGGKFVIEDETAGAAGPIRFVIDGAGRTGINAPSPTDTLTVGGVIRSTTGGIKFPDGTVQATAQLIGPQGIQGIPGPTGPQGPAGPPTPWTVQGSTIYYAGGSVGVGSAVPQDGTALHVSGPVAGQLRVETSNQYVPSSISFGSSSAGWQVGASNLGFPNLATGSFFVGKTDLPVPPLQLGFTGRIGVNGVPAAQVPLVVNGPDAQVALRNTDNPSGNATYVAGMACNTVNNAYPEGALTFQSRSQSGTFVANHLTLLLGEFQQNDPLMGVGLPTPGYTLHVNGTAGKPDGGSWSTASDGRLKRNVETLHGALDSLLQLRGVTYEYIDPATINELPGTRIGMIAQEVEAVFPHWVDVGADGMRRLTFRGFEALTVEALRDLREQQDARIDSVLAENAELRAQVAELASTVDRLVRIVEGGGR